MRLYADANILISSVRQEIGKNFRLLAQDTDLFLGLCSTQNHILILSEWFFEEVERVISLKKEDVIEYFQNAKVTIEIVEDGPITLLITQIQREMGLHYGDAKHVAIAYTQKCEWIITWNLRDFEKADKCVKPINPKEFIDSFGPSFPFLPKKDTH